VTSLSRLDDWDCPGGILGRPGWCHSHRNNHVGVVSALPSLLLDVTAYTRQSLN
jgi:hypothetical protein